MLKEEMDDATKSADEIRADIQAFRNRLVPFFILLVQLAILLFSF